jgi:hypothetical protein
MESKKKQCGIKWMLLANAFTISVDHCFGGILLASVMADPQRIGYSGEMSPEPNLPETFG